MMFLMAAVDLSVIEFTCHHGAQPHMSVAMYYLSADSMTFVTRIVYYTV